MNTSGKRFNQQDIIDKVSSIAIDENSLAFGDIIVNRYDSYTGEQDNNGLLVGIHVCGFNDGLPLFVGIIRSTVNAQDAINHAMENVASRCRALTLERLMRDVMGDMSGMDQD